MTSHSISAKPGGFSLVELLVVIAIIGVLVAIAVPVGTQIRGSAKKVIAQRHAQEAASMSSAAAAAGITHVVPELAGGIEATLALLVTGIKATTETGIPVDLRLALSDGEISDAARFLKLRYTDDLIMMEYNSSGIE